MLYHPCANKVMVARLRAIVVNCIRKHVITASNQLTEDRPLALISWGCRMTMSWVDRDKVVNFIKVILSMISRPIQPNEITF